MIAPAMAADDMSQFSPTQQFAYGQFLFAKAFVDTMSSPTAKSDPKGTAAKLDRMSEEAIQLHERTKGKIDKTELQTIMQQLIVTPEYQDVQRRGAAIGEELKRENYYNCTELRDAIQRFFFAAMGLRAQ